MLRKISVARGTAMLAALLLALPALPSIPCAAGGADPVGPAAHPAAGSGAPPGAGPVRGCGQDRVVAAGPIAVMLSERGDIVEVASKARGWRRAARLRTTLGECEAVGPVTSRDLEPGGVEFTRKLRHLHGGGECTLLESFRPAAESIRWDIEIRGAGEPWSAHIETVIEWPGADRSKFWTAWGDSRKGQAPDWSDPLRPDAFKDQEFHYGEVSASVNESGAPADYPLL